MNDHRRPRNSNGIQNLVLLYTGRCLSYVLALFVFTSTPRMPMISSSHDIIAVCQVQILCSILKEAVKEVSRSLAIGSNILIRTCRFANLVSLAVGDRIRPFLAIRK